jgi:hypothetical protein
MLSQDFFSDISPSDRTMALGSTQLLVKMSTRNIHGSKGGRCVRLTTSPTLRAECQEIWEPKPPGTLWATPGQLRESYTFTFTYIVAYDVCKTTKSTTQKKTRRCFSVTVVLKRTRQNVLLCKHFLYFYIFKRGTRSPCL